MKKVVLILMAMVFIACKKEASVDYAIIAGKITNKPIGEVTINSLDRSFTKPLLFSKDGTFKDTLNIDTNTYVLYDGTNPVFIHLEPGNQLDITYDAQDFSNSLVISGKGSEVSNYLILKRKNEQDAFGNSADIYTLNEGDFKAKINDLKKTNIDLLENTKGLSDDYIVKEKRDLHYFYLTRLIDYEEAHKYFTRNEAFSVSDDFLNEINDFDYSNEEDYKFSSNYKRIVSDYFTKQSIELTKNEAIEKDLAFVKSVSTLDNEVIKNGLLFNFANFNMSYSKDIDAFYNAFLASSTDEANNEIVTEKYTKLTAVAKGRPSPKFVDYENIKGGTTSLDDLKGKYVYIDVWATWCGPCRAEIPSLKAIEEQYHGKNIEFVSISIDKAADHDKWESMVVNEVLGGVQLFADNDWNSSFVKDYQINGIPRFILIDSDGNIMDSNAPRPSSPELVHLFNELSI
ncbi:TlpA family protein disulfide reductase [Algibacter mikhailovii]|uniref:Thioredoxin domain-containing protein n=1 Tax=Algibacter mikhailovii TaxID=425498 RepID=A0A918QRM3_9FLAO|nr:TlpA disulfide reductase family protein [Algibacter mikhailovii]GGZ69141.1 hypothetical protein GCM10007028_02620 [Algibacter mikhailovii]